MSRGLFDRAIPDWVDDAQCRDVDTDMFFSNDPFDIASAKQQHCRICRVAMECLDAHLYTDYGVFGGTTPDERKRLRRKARAA